MDDSGIDEFLYRGGRINDDNTVTVYHGTTKDKAQSILRSGCLVSPSDASDTYGVYVSTSPEISESYGDGTVLVMEIPVKDLVFDDVFPDGRMDFRVNTRGHRYCPQNIRLYEHSQKLAAGPRQLRGQTVFCPMYGETSFTRGSHCPFFSGVEEGDVVCLFDAPKDEELYPFRRKGRRIIASVLDMPKEHLDENLWDLSGDRPQLDLEVKDKIVYTLQDWLNEQGVGTEWISALYFIGSSAGYQYKEQSDIDITIVPDLEKLRAAVGDEGDNEKIKALVRKMIKKLNGWELIKHPVNYYIRLDADVPPGEAIYDIFSDIWIKAPEKIPKDMFPEDRFRDLYTEAEGKLGQIDEVIGRLGRRLHDYEVLSAYEEDDDISDKVKDKLARKEKAIRQWVEWLLNVYKETHRQRAKDYSEGEGQESRGNILYKYLEQYGYIDFMVNLKNIYSENWSVKRIRKALEKFYKNFSSRGY